MVKQELVAAVLLAAFALADVGNAEYLGCFFDEPSQRDLPLPTLLNDNNKPTACMAFCKDKQYRYAGLQNAIGCWCGNSYGAHGEANSQDCNKPCPADESVMCGAFSRNSVYRSGYVGDTNYQGCYVDEPAKRDLPHLPQIFGDANKPSACMDFCAAHKYKYAGLQNGVGCWCGDSFGAYGEAITEECSKFCPADNSDRCGGHSRNSVYETGYLDKVEYLGCFFDDPSQRDLPLPTLLNDDNKPSACMAFCKHREYRYAGLQNAVGCWCGNSYGSHGEAQSQDCNKPCPADGSVMCGASSRNSIYDSGYAGDLNYQGCYVDEPAERDLPHLPKTFVDDNKPSMCMSYCAANNFKYAGLQNGIGCWCGDSFGAHGEAKTEECSKFCPADNSNRCGGYSRNSVYETGYVGCYVDDPTQRDLPLSKLLHSENEPSACKDYCYMKGYQYAGLQHGVGCWCGNSFGEHGEADASQCDTACPAEPSIMCGGYSRNSVYETGFIVHKAFLGCYYDDPAHRDLPHPTVLGDSNEPSACMKYCESQSYNYAGLQNGVGCWCGNSYGNHGEAVNDQCNKPCPADDSFMCGGYSRNSVYETHYNGQ